ncbi:HD domain-containing protein [Saccharothrix australiensis]|uniref:Metal dependent phosphohydrolase n=1 Tax=Saccharothrix australiensis TaxID=2072 RepID=A0A495W5S5_9PSEU|nr:HD domain-containing protein [Saccharothrix australiensis]RKT55168.1 metal dependent phosphohydrolase [Saccharothrix australiensis]
MDTYPDLPFPRTDLAVAAERYARDLEDPAIFNHSMRAYLYGRLIGEGRGLRPDVDYDDELLFLGCVLHDVGLSEPGNGDQTFNVDGADLAAKFLADQGAPAEWVEVVWDAVALHVHLDVAARKRPEIALLSAGTGYDCTGSPEDLLPEGYAERVHAVLPRLHAAAVLRKEIVDQVIANPLKATLFSLPAELTHQVTGVPKPTWEELTTAPRWNDYERWTG